MINQQREQKVLKLIEPYLTLNPDTETKIVLWYKDAYLNFTSYSSLFKFSYDLWELNVLSKDDLNIYYLISCDALQLNLITTDNLTVYDFFNIKEGSRITNQDNVHIELFEFYTMQDAVNHLLTFNY